MPRSKSPENYPEQFGELIRHAVARLVRIPCADHKAAKALMGRLYAYHGALKAARTQAQCPEHIREIAQMAPRVQYRVEDNVLVARPQDMDPDGARIMDALKVPGQMAGIPVPSTGPIAPSEDLLKSLATLTPRGGER